MKQIVTHFFHPKLEVFCLGLKVHYSKPMRLTFCHGLPILQTQNLTICFRRNKYTWQSPNDQDITW